jgi:acetoacetyl-CoA reductase
MFHRMTPDQWNAVINTNLGSLFNMTRPVIEGMRARKFGRYHQYLVHQRPEGPDGAGELFRGESGRHRIHQSIGAGRRQSGITVNAICPGYIATEMVKAVPQDVLEKSILPYIPTGRLGEPDEIARCVVFLASDESSFITGATLTATAGSIMA